MEERNGRTQGRIRRRKEEQEGDKSGASIGSRYEGVRDA